MLTALLLLAGAAPDPLDVYGDWMVEGEKGIVTVARCAGVPEAEDGSPCGTLTRLPPDAPPEAADVLGTRLLWGFEQDDDEWEDGRVLDPEEDKSYRAKIWREEDGLHVKGCVGIFCKSQVWTLAE